MKKFKPKHSKTQSSIQKFPSTNNHIDNYSQKEDFSKKDFKKSKQEKSSFHSNKFSKKVNSSEEDFKKSKQEKSSFHSNKFSKKINSSEKDFKKSNLEKPIKNTLSGEVRLNRYISNCGICSRREADEWIKKGLVKVNGKVVQELGIKVKVGVDEVLVNGKKAKLENFVYILLNKPKNCITTLEDEKGRKTVMDFIKGATDQRVYPVGRLDRNTTGLLLLTNDGELAKALSHPSSEVPKIYYARLDRPITNQEIEKLLEGIELEDGFIAADRAGLVEGTNDEVGIEIHSGKNHIIKRMFKAIGYEVIALDRVSYGFLNKKGLKKGSWRFLTEKEIAFIKMNYLSKKTLFKKDAPEYKLKITSKKPLDFVDEFEDFVFDEKDLENIDFNSLFQDLNDDFDENEWNDDLVALEDVDFDDI